METKLISIIVPCYNQAQYLDEALQSVFDQTYSDWECIIVNDGSPDNTEEVAMNWLKKDMRFKYVKKDNGGLSSARNAGIEKAVGDWILPLDADDKISNRYLELANEEFNKGYTVIYCEAERFGTEEGRWDLPPYSMNKLAQTNVIFCTAFFKRADFTTVGGYDENMKSGLEDWDFWLSLLKNGGAVYKIGEVCFYYRVKESSMIIDFKRSVSKNTSTLEYIEAKHLSFFHEQLGTMHHLLKQNNDKKEVIDIITNRRKVSRFVNQVYSALEKLKITR